MAETFTFQLATASDIAFGTGTQSTLLPDGTTGDLPKVNSSDLFDYVAVTYSATPVFSVANGLFQTITLTGNVSSSTITNGASAIPDGIVMTLQIIQDGTGGRTFVFPTTVYGHATMNTLVGLTASVRTIVLLQYSTTASLWIPVSISTGGKVERLMAGGRSLTSGQFALSAGWGTTASVGTISGSDSRGKFTVTSSGTGQGASPTITFTFIDGAFPSAPFAIVSNNGGSQPAVFPTWTTSTTTLVVTFPGTPSNSQSFVFSFIIVG